ncbi:hypothetical protein KDW_04510 [Dictyobacter vulcani]|uniref:HTH cro/C1-type domain-containing protein n=1 Tax=Dictyobacter vulcani TaxID=2607529 RepID=A0A5J4KJ93_9CHLR|nr:helix-turn-helix transcriptional regulator [Dictyobacter vulcani]GER86289.1 hypothetical protein KDW_04510 [Dictyobacter vulcani]
MKPRLKVKEIAQAKGYNMSSLSRKADVSFRTIKRYFRNPFDPATTDTLGRVAQALDVEIGDLIEMVPDDYHEKESGREE